MARDLIAEARQAHNRAMLDPVYRIDYAFDIFREEMSGYIPYVRREEEKDTPAEVWLDDRQERIVLNLKAELDKVKAHNNYLENKINEHLDKPKKKRKVLKEIEL